MANLPTRPWCRIGTHRQQACPSVHAGAFPAVSGSLDIAFNEGPLNAAADGRVIRPGAEK